MNTATVGELPAHQAEQFKPSALPSLIGESFASRHIGPSEAEITVMLQTLGLSSLDELVAKTVPAAIRHKGGSLLPAPLSERELLNRSAELAAKNKSYRSLLGMGYYDCITASVIERNILENPGWYTQYTPYQAEIAQGRLEALLNFQTMVADLTGLPLANASLLDEATAAAEAMAMCRGNVSAVRNTFFIASDCHPQTIAVVSNRLEALGLACHVGPARDAKFSSGRYFGLLLQYPTTDGRIEQYDELTANAHIAGTLVVAAADILALALIRPPGEFGCDIAVGSTQRLGMPLGFGGPHAAYLACKPEFARKMPGRIVGVSRDAAGQPALRLAIQTREQHIKREKATSNICTAQVLPAVVAAMHAVYHGPAGLKRIAEQIHAATAVLAAGIEQCGHRLAGSIFFDTLRVIPAKEHEGKRIMADALARGINLRHYPDGSIGVSLDEKTDGPELQTLLAIFSGAGRSVSVEEAAARASVTLEAPIARTSHYLTHPVFNQHHSETEMQRYMRQLESRDLSLTTSMIPLGSCTMKLNAAAEMAAITQPGWANIHPFAPKNQWLGYAELFAELESALAAITGFAAVSLQPNAGSQGEYAGLLAIRAWHKSRGQGQRNICLIPVSAHGTNPASAVVAGYEVVTVACDAHGNIDLSDLAAKAAAHAESLGCLMVTYPSTHGVFEEGITEICRIVHEHGGQVYMDGANLNAQVGLCRPGDIGADVCHLNLHKTFCIPHGGGGPGMGPIAVAQHLAPFLPGNPITHDKSAVGPVAAAPWGSALILTIPWAYIAMMGEAGLKRATQVAILNANYMARKLEKHYPVLFKGRHGFCAHEFIIDCHAFEAAGIRVDDIAKRLMDYGFHAPTVSWPEPGTMMIEPTESESPAELDRFCEALIAIRREIQEVLDGRMDRSNNPLKNAPHTAMTVTAQDWPHPYSRRQAAYPAPWLEQHKFWPAVSRIDNPWGDRNLFCTCPAPTAT
ncbi:MAG: aminomethyl-transferring glycine dehydrogenase [Phycisphaerales bacterium]|nr:aminomethyl-transferring glycine dehydrogenase [Phycisphaerales bacterium]